MFTASIAARPDFHAVPQALTVSIDFNWTLPPFDNRDARQAFCLAINRVALVQGLPQSTSPLPGVPPIPSGHLVPQGMPGYYPQLTGIDGTSTTTGDLAKAQAHWEAYLSTLHGAPLPTMTVEVYTYTAALKYLHNYLEAAWTTAFPQVAGHFVDSPFPHTILAEQAPPATIFKFGWLADYPDPQDFLSRLHASGAPNNLAKSSVPDADALMSAADRLSAPAQQSARMSAYHQAEQELIQQVAACPLYQTQIAYLLRPYVSGMRQTSLGLIPNNDWIAGYIAQH